MVKQAIDRQQFVLFLGLDSIQNPMLPQIWGFSLYIRVNKNSLLWGFPLLEAFFGRGVHIFRCVMTA